MPKKLVRIIDIHPQDAYHRKRNLLIGVTGEFTNRNYTTGDYMSGQFYFNSINRHIFEKVDSDIKIWGTNEISFFGIIIEEVNN